MREELKLALQVRWEESLKERAALAPESVVPALDMLLAPIREQAAEAGRNRIREGRKGGRKTSPPKFLPTAGRAPLNM